MWKIPKSVFVALAFVALLSPGLVCSQTACILTGELIEACDVPTALQLCCTNKCSSQPNECAAGEFGDPCCENDDCDGDLVCTGAEYQDSMNQPVNDCGAASPNGTARKTCAPSTCTPTGELAPEGCPKTGTNEDCCSNKCDEGNCIAGTTAGDPCCEDDDCEGNSTCTGEDAADIGLSPCAEANTSNTTPRKTCVPGRAPRSKKSRKTRKSKTRNRRLGAPRDLTKLPKSFKPVRINGALRG